MPKFINRTNELKSLAELWQEKKSQLVVIYGKRRIGKTEIIKQFSLKKPHAYFLAKQTTEINNLNKLGQIIGQALDDKALELRGFAKWQEVFVYLKEKITKPFILAIDEFPYLIEGAKGLTSIWQDGWDNYLKDTPIFLILCGSSIAMMESEVLAYKSPLYGRRTGQIWVKPLAFQHAFEFLPESLSFAQKMHFYSLAGGNPSYLLKVNQHVNYLEAIKKEILTPQKTLYEEVDFILKQELREPRNYFSILKAIALSNTKFSEIINQTGIDKHALHNYLFVLEDLHLIEKQTPITEKNPLKSRLGRYFLKDQFITFWFNYVFPFKDELEYGNKQASLNAVQKQFHKIVEANFERIAQDILRSYQSKVLVLEKLGRWWDKNQEIDIVGLNSQTKQILFGEVKWYNKQVGTNIYESLKDKARLVDWPQGFIKGNKKRQEYYCLFSKSGFTKNMIKLAKEEKVWLFEKDQLARN